MKIEKVALKSFWEVTPEDLGCDEGAQMLTHEGKECVAQRRRWEVERLLEDGLEPGESEIN